MLHVPELMCIVSGLYVCLLGIYVSSTCYKETKTNIITSSSLNIISKLLCFIFDTYCPYCI